jgi:hypothetical protein
LKKDIEVAVKIAKHGKLFDLLYFIYSLKALLENFLVPEKLNFQLKHRQLFKSGAIALHYQRWRLSTGM